MGGYFNQALVLLAAAVLLLPLFQRLGLGSILGYLAAGIVIGPLGLGLIPGADYQDLEAHLLPGDRLLIYSDGVTECAAPGGDLLDDAGLARLLGELRETRGLACLEAIIWKLAQFAGTDSFADDVSAVLLEIKPAAPSG